MSEMLENKSVPSPHVSYSPPRGHVPQRMIAWAVHLFTTTGVIWALLATVSIAKHRAGLALFWLLIAQVVDGLDGPLARKFNVRRFAPVIDGNVLDLVIDYLTCVVVPMVFALRFGMYPAGLRMWMIAAVLYVSALWFARRDIETKDIWFRGFPAAWNLVITFFWILDTHPTANVFISLILIVLTLTPQVKFFHAMSSKQFRRISLPFTILMMLMAAWMVRFHDRYNSFGHFVVIAWVLYTIVLSIWRSTLPDELGE